uniref:Fe2OG dioxygenase domain-containing protein n=1 Tax=Anopheles minimus TaxID=112268 RepID=A0A182W530_9DIPT
MMTQYDSRACCWRGPFRPTVLNPAANLGPVLLNVLERTPQKAAQVNGDTGYVMTCDELRRRSIRFAQFLIARDYRIGDVVVLIARNSDNVAPVVFGCFLAGVTLNTLDPSFGLEEVQHILRLTRPRAVVGDSDALVLVCEAASRMELCFDKAFFLLEEIEGHDFTPLDSWISVDALVRVPDKNEDQFVPAYQGDSDQLIAAVVCSSGTTGLPKAVRISHAQLIASYQRVSQLDRNDTILCFSTLYWISGLQMLMTGVLNGIRRIITARLATPELAIQLCNRYHVTLLLVTPTMASDIIRTLSPTERLESVKLFAVGGSAVPKRLRDEINRRVLVAGRGRSFVGYGTSETGNIAYELIPRDDSVGFLLPGVTAKIVNDHDQPLGPNETGELIVRPVHPFLGYHGDETATKETKVNGDAEGFVRTGDIARFDSDGFLYLVDRKREIFKYDGFQIAPTELEQRIAELEGIRYVVVVGLPDPDHRYNDLATALIVRESHDTQALTEQMVIEHCARTPDRQVRPKQKWLRGGVIFVDQLPMTASGKVKRSAAKQLAMERKSTNTKESAVCAMFQTFFKYYKSRNQPPTYENVLVIGMDHPKLQPVQLNCSDERKFMGLLPTREWKVYELTTRPGLLVLANPFTCSGQRHWIMRSMSDYPTYPNITNLTNRDVEYSWLEELQSIPTESERRKFAKQLRWATLGYQYDWTNKVYDEARKEQFPTELSSLVKYVATAFGYGWFSPEAAIVNYYPIGSTLAGHTDHSEDDQLAPLFSFSFGQPAIFLIGGTTLDEEPDAILLRSGDIVIMTGASRQCYHAVPRVFTDSELLEELGNSAARWEGMEDLKEVWNVARRYIKYTRININVRQVLREDQSTLQPDSEKHKS